VRVPKIYIESSVFNFYFADNDPEKQRDTVKLFEEIRQGKYVPYTSAAVLQELLRCSEPKQSLMTDLLNRYAIQMLPASNEADALADVYVEEGIIPLKYRTDGIHIAITAINNLDFIVSYNFKHIVKRKTIEMTEIINYREGYKKVGIYSPTEVIEDVE
jgi:predicted nucleic acid-binding protein